jgi:hypothetical protein
MQPEISADMDSKASGQIKRLYQLSQECFFLLT